MVRPQEAENRYDVGVEWTLTKDAPLPCRRQRQLGKMEGVQGDVQHQWCLDAQFGQGTRL